MRISTEQAHALFDCFEDSGLLIDPDGSWRKQFHLEVSVLGHKKWTSGPWTLMNEWGKLKPPRLSMAPLGDMSTPEREIAEADRLERVNAEIARIMSDEPRPVPDFAKEFPRITQAEMEAMDEPQWEAFFAKVDDTGPYIITSPHRADVVMLSIKQFERLTGEKLCSEEPESSTEPRPDSSPTP